MSPSQYFARSDIQHVFWIFRKANRLNGLSTHLLISQMQSLVLTVNKSSEIFSHIWTFHKSSSEKRWFLRFLNHIDLCKVFWCLSLQLFFSVFLLWTRPGRLSSGLWTLLEMMSIIETLCPQLRHCSWLSVFHVQCITYHDSRQLCDYLPAFKLNCICQTQGPRGESLPPSPHILLNMNIFLIFMVNFKLMTNLTNLKGERY